MTNDNILNLLICVCRTTGLTPLQVAEALGDTEANTKYQKAVESVYETITNDVLNLD